MALASCPGSTAKRSRQKRNHGGKNPQRCADHIQDAQDRCGRLDVLCELRVARANGGQLLLLMLDEVFELGILGMLPRCAGDVPVAPSESDARGAAARPGMPRIVPRRAAMAGFPCASLARFTTLVRFATTAR